MTPCKECQNRPAMVAELLKVYADGNPVNAMEILAEVITHDANLHEADKQELAEVMHLLAAIAKQVNSDLTEEVHFLKIPA